jgi:D-alanine-D-alanine ligase
VKGKMLKVGLTYDLREDYLREGYSHEDTAEFDKEDTILALEEAIRKAGHQPVRIGHVRKLVIALAAGERWDVVFNIAEGLHGLAREAQVPALLDAFDIPYVFSDGLVLALTLQKAFTKRIIRDAGLPTADFFELRSLNQLPEIKLPYPLFAKPVAEGTGKGITGKSKISSMEELRNVCTELLEKFNQPVLIETFLPGREFTVGVVGTGDKARTTGIMEVHFVTDHDQAIYSLENKENYEQYMRYSVPEQAVAESCYKLALDVWNVLGCRDGGRIDIRMDEKGIPNFIEVNPLAGLHPVHSDLPMLSRMNGTSYQALIEMILESAIMRLH